MHPMRSTKRSLFFLATGAAAAYLFDPQSGRARREQLRAKLQQYAPSGASDPQSSAGTGSSPAANPSISDTVDSPAPSSPVEVLRSDPNRDDLLGNEVAAPASDSAPDQVHWTPST